MTDVDRSDANKAQRILRPVAKRQEKRRGYLLVEYGECAIFKNSWDAEPLAYVNGWDAAREWIDRRAAKEKRVAKKAAAP